MPPVNLHAEMWRAIQLARHPPIAVAFAEQGFTRLVQWGFQRVSYFGPEGRSYEPQQDGNVMAFIVPVVEGGETIDLCAIDPRSQHVGTRLGLGRGLGLQAVDKARFGYPLKLMARPLDWLRDPVGSCYLFDLGELRTALDGVQEIVCTDLEFAERAQSLLPPSESERVVVTA
jgi:hypothetical protein